GPGCRHGEGRDGARAGQPAGGIGLVGPGRSAAGDETEECGGKKCLGAMEVAVHKAKCCVPLMRLPPADLRKCKGSVRPTRKASSPNGQGCCPAGLPSRFQLLCPGY